MRITYEEGSDPGATRRSCRLPLRDYVDREILAPLGMTSTTWEAASVPKDRLPTARGDEER
jgi:CubicO group peptidase (beta-lactamase class C family)